MTQCVFCGKELDWDFEDLVYYDVRKNRVCDIAIKLTINDAYKIYYHKPEDDLNIDEREVLKRLVIE